MTTSPCSPLLTWRDVQHLLVRTSRPVHLRAADWKTNGAGHKGEVPWDGKSSIQREIRGPQIQVIHTGWVLSAGLGTLLLEALCSLTWWRFSTSISAVLGGSGVTGLEGTAWSQGRVGLDVWGMFCPRMWWVWNSSPGQWARPWAAGAQGMLGHRSQTSDLDLGGPRSWIQ